MNIKILVVEDNAQKYGKIHQALLGGGVDEGSITHVIAASQALSKLQDETYDLMLLDVNIPKRLGDDHVKRGGGLDVLHDISRDETYNRPRYIIGITAFEDVLTEFGGAFEEQLWSLIHYSDTTDRWISQLRLKLDYIKAFKRSEHFSDGKTYGTDLAIVAALDTVEFDAIKNLPCDWQPLRLNHDETRYLTGSIHTERGDFSVVAAAAPRMGMPASTALAAKIVHQFRPRYLGMVGICAGRAEKVKVGDIIVADPTWDWGSGKIQSEDKLPKFLPSPHQLDLDADLLSTIKELSEDKARLAVIKQRARGSKPPFELNVRVGPLVSGAAVVAHKPTFDRLLDQHRGILGIDMEAYGVAIAARGSGKPRPISVIVKGVCDYADEEKDDDFQEYAASVSADFFYQAALKFL